MRFTRAELEAFRGCEVDDLAPPLMRRRLPMRTSSLASAVMHYH
jgi:hypothetical protein